MSKKELYIGNRAVGENHPPYIIAEAGVHHYNSVELAKTYILQAKIAGADAIKFQTYTAQRIVTTWAPTYWDAPEGVTQFDIFAERSNLAKEDYQVLFDYARQLDIAFLSTPFDPDSAALLAEFEMPAFKIASADLTYFTLLETVASFKKPILLSTGAATYKEVAETVAFLQNLQAKFILLHCVLSYPTPVKDANLHRITELQKQFPDMIIGYSDHTQPQDTMAACPIAVALGAKVVEKHFTLNKFLDGDDHYHAVDPEGLKRLVQDCKDAHIMTVKPKELQDSELPARTNARRSIVAAKPLSAGTTLCLQDIDFKRPGTGLSPMQVDQVLGRTLNTALQTDDLIKLEHLGSL